MTIPTIPEWVKKSIGWLWKRLFPAKEKTSDQSQSISADGNVTIQDSQLSVQKYGDHSTTVTTQAIHLHQGVSYLEVENIALTIWRANFPQLKREAMEEAERRVHRFLRELEPKLAQQLTPLQRERFRTPEIQYSFNQAIQTAALHDEPELQQVVIDLVVARVREEPASTHAIIYAEAIKTLPALTTDMVNILAVHYLVRSVRLRNARDWSDLAVEFQQTIKPLLTFSASRLELQHLVYAGCGTFPAGTLMVDFVRFFQRHYAKLFQNPVPDQGLEAQGRLHKAQKYGLELFDARSKMGSRFRFASSVEFENYLVSKVAEEEERAQFRGWFEGAFPKAEIARSMLLGNVPEFELLLNKWPKGSPLGSFQLTPVGRAIGECRLLSLSGSQLEWETDER